MKIPSDLNENPGFPFKIVIFSPSLRNTSDTKYRPNFVSIPEIPTLKRPYSRIPYAQIVTYLEVSISLMFFLFPSINIWSLGSEKKRKKI